MLGRPGFAVLTCAATVLASATLGGCSPLGTKDRPRPSSPQLTQAEKTHEYPSPAPHPQSATGDDAGPVQAIRAFAMRDINWSATAVSAQMQSLASESVGQARSEMQLAAAQTGGDYELRRGGIANRGTV